MGNYKKTTNYFVIWNNIYSTLMLGNKESYPNIRLHSLTETLIKVAKFSTDDIKTAVGAIRKDNEGEEIVAYSFNQCIDGEYQHAEAILIKYCNMLNLIVYSFIVVIIVYKK